MPYFITESAPGCDGWATVKDDGEVIGCHATKQAAIDQMVAVSIAEDMEPGGERALQDAVITDIDDTIIRNGDQPVRKVIERINSLTGELYVITGRTEDDRSETVATLQASGLRAFTLLMRQNDMVNSADFKQDEARRIMRTYNITHVFENDPSAQAAYRELGLTVTDPVTIRSDRALEQRAVDLPRYMRQAASRGLELRAEGYGGDGLTDKTIREARDIAAGTMSDDKVIRANAWGARHAVDLEAAKNSNPEDEEWPGAGAVAHYLWGIDPLDPEPARDWLARNAERITNERHSMPTKIETRELHVPDMEVRSLEDGRREFVGYAAVFNSDSEPLPFIERIQPGAFQQTLASRNNVKMFVNHDDTQVLATTRSGTLRLSEDAKGLRVEATLPDTTAGRDLATLLEARIVDSMSFGFSIPPGGDSWSSDGQTRTLESIRLHEVSVVTGWPAYAATEAGVRKVRHLIERTAMESELLIDALSAFEAGQDLTSDQATALHTAIDALAPVADAAPNDLSAVDILRKKLELEAKKF